MKVFRIIITSLLIAWMALIFCLSAESAAESSGTSGRLITAVIRFFYSKFDEMSSADKLALIESFQFFVRKAAHFSLYGVLGALSYASVVTYKKLSFAFKFLLSGMICLLYSVSDEIHQYYVPGRSCELTDVLIDLAGALLAITLLAMIIRKVKSRKNTDFDYKAEKKRKKAYALSEDNIADLSSELEDVKYENKLLRARIEELKEEMILKEQEVEEIKTQTVKKPLQISPEKEMGAKSIGRIIVSAAKYCNQLSGLAENKDIKELVNLILGRTEVAKAEILNIITTDSSVEDMETKIKQEEIKAEDYFISVLGQI